MTRDEIWMWFAAGALSQFQSPGTASTVADGLLEEFEKRFAPITPEETNDQWMKRQEHPTWARQRQQ